MHQKPFPVYEFITATQTRSCIITAGEGFCRKQVFILRFIDFYPRVETVGRKILVLVSSDI